MGSNKIDMCKLIEILFSDILIDKSICFYRNDIDGGCNGFIY